MGKRSIASGEKFIILYLGGFRTRQYGCVTFNWVWAGLEPARTGGVSEWVWAGLEPAPTMTGIDFGQVLNLPKRELSTNESLFSFFGY